MMEALAPAQTGEVAVKEEVGKGLIDTVTDALSVQPEVVPVT